ncbi:MerR family transcriptional regulator [uncultured Enterovirga sp.]|uniref:MerR family transcriptional regulator n=1 Tax=uncultured Enterovirga sp. TaxID=2026352 RepID=UPI0035CA7E22
MNKGPDAFRTISEVAEDLDIPQHVLRFWETRFTSIRPLKRGGGRRYYRPDDVELLKGIRQLLYGQGYTIKGVQRILKEDGLRFVQGVGRGETAVLPVSPEADDGAEYGPDDGPTSEDTGPDEPEPEGVRQDRTGARTASFRAEAGGLAARDRDLLRAALDELLDCERALDSLKRD